jgi:hypothetical protein
MNPLFDNIAGMTLSLVAIIFRRQFAEHIIKFQNETFGFEFGEGWIRWSEFLIIIGCTSNIVSGLLRLL